MNGERTEQFMNWLEVIVTGVCLLSLVVVVWLMILGIVPLTWGTFGALLFFLLLAIVVSPATGGVHGKQ